MYHSLLQNNSALGKSSNVGIVIQATERPGSSRPQPSSPQGGDRGYSPHPPASNPSSPKQTTTPTSVPASKK